MKLHLIGETFGRLTVLSKAESKHRKSRWNCKCSCGNTTTVYWDTLKKGRAKSCGCLAKELSSKRAKNTFTTHGLSQSPEYITWQAMKQRCYDPNFEQYKDYGGRGIKVCDEWLNNFEQFLNDMGTKPSNKHTIDRIDNNKNYTPENCVWATRKNQNRHTRATKLNAKQVKEIRSKYKSGIKQARLAEEYNVGSGVISNVVNYVSWKDI